MRIIVFEKEIEKGVEFLNKVYPDWLSKIDLEKLNMDQPSNCILGQLYGNFYVAQNILDMSDKNYDKMGFTVPIVLYYDEHDNEKWDTLAKEWKEKIVSLRNKISQN